MLCVYMNRERTKKKNRPTKKKQNQIESDHTITQGVLHVHSKGFGFVSSDNPDQYPEDVFIPKHLKGTAVDGDYVKVAVYTKKRLNKGPEGKILTVIKRKKKHLVGIVWMVDKKYYTLYIHSLGDSKRAIVKRDRDIDYYIGDRLLLKIIDWGNEKDLILCSVLQSLGTIDDAKTDIPAAIKDFEICDTFPKSVIKQVKQFPKTIGRELLKERLNCTDLTTFTIDPDTAQDFDDALTLTKDRDGHFHLGVHIADVSHYAHKETPLNLEAKIRCNSTYFPGKVVPMLPEELSNNLCSLKENVIRLTISVLITLDTQGNTKSYKIVRSYIKSHKRFTYKQARDVLEKKVHSPYYSTLKQMEKLCHILKKRRIERGSVDLALPEITILVDENGNPYDYEEVQYDITHQIVEEFMLKANEIVAKDLASQGLPSVYRVHDTPSPEDLEDFYALARGLGFTVHDKPTVQEIQTLFSLAKKTPYAQQLAIAYIRSMKLAVYSSQNVGHYGLALDYYCHFTSPIRRYSDLVVHQLLFDKVPPKDLQEIGKRCSEQERNSFKAEMYVINLKKLRLLKLYQRDDAKRIYKGVVNKIKPFGIFFEVSPIQVEGFFHLSELEDDYYVFQSDRHILVGRNSGRAFKTGTKLDLFLEDIDLISMKSTWMLRRRKSRKHR